MEFKQKQSFKSRTIEQLLDSAIDQFKNLKSDIEPQIMFSNRTLNLLADNGLIENGKYKGITLKLNDDCEFGNFYVQQK